MDNFEKKAGEPGKIGYVHGFKDIPINAIPLPSNEVLKRQYRIMDKWHPTKEMFLMKHGHEVLGGMAAFSGFAYVTHMRRMMLLRSKVRFASYGPAMILPLMVTSLAQHTFVTKDLSLGITSCPVCLEMRSASIQIISGVANPFLLAVFSTTVAAKVSSTYPIPPITDYKNLFKIYLRLCRPLIYPTLCLMIANVACSIMTTFSQFHAIQKINRKLIEDDIYIP